MSEFGWGQGSWGDSPWGTSGEPIGGVTPPTITPIDPQENETGIARNKRICIQFTDDGQDGTFVELSSLRISVSGTNYVLGGAPINGASIDVEANDGNGFNVDLELPNPFTVGTRQEVSVTVTDTVGNRAEKTYFFSIGVGPRLLGARNPAEGILVAQFNQPMEQSSTFLFPANWKVSAVTEGALPLEVTKVEVKENHPDVALLRYKGGGSTYRLTTIGLLSQDGDPLEKGHESVTFDLLFSAEDAPTIRLFNTIFGPIGVSQRLLKRRTMDGHVANRAIALAADEQFRLKLQTLDGTESRTGRPGRRRT